MISIYMKNMDKSKQARYVLDANITPIYTWLKFAPVIFLQFSSVTQSCLGLCEPMNHSTPGLPVHHQLPGLTQIHVH